MIDRLMKKIEPHFTRGGKLELFYPIFEMVVTITFVGPKRTEKGAHIRDYYDIKRLMISVIYAGLPAMAFGMFNAGYQHFASMGRYPGFFECMTRGAFLVVPLFIVVYAVGGFWEILFAVVRKHEINEGFLVTGFLLPLIVPPAIPWWQLAIAVSFGVVVGKELFGGTGMNVFNPALVARAFLFFAYPASISGDGVWTAFGQNMVDTYTAATPLAVAAVQGPLPIVDVLAQKGYTFWTMFLGLIPGSVGETSTMAILMGAAFLLLNGVASWRTMISVFAGGTVMALVFNAVAPSPGSVMALPPHYHLVMGGFAFGAVFMATDPVSSAATDIGKIFYGFFIGVLAILVRVLNPAYPEGMMLAILFMNAFAPLIDNIVVWFNVRRRRRRATE
ncbi:MAG: NADH:ubiquinone reductase (Na(+)-transporting) subunit B [Spirochaetae bacterium HGW-Spirochaetae-1]|nr:MAG: NADH:ubiquinone reductase (Na(+)-transporting) subunit B [Spirochaetae bacterium HGW-Spirochaetae-1]